MAIDPILISWVEKFLSGFEPVNGGVPKALILQTTLDGINQWCVRNNMSLSPRQCKEIFICFLKNNPDFPPLTIDEQPID